MIESAERPSGWTTSKPNLVAAYPGHVPMGLPLPPKVDEPDDDDARYSL